MSEKGLIATLAFDLDNPDQYLNLQRMLDADEAFAALWDMEEWLRQ